MLLVQQASGQSKAKRKVFCLAQSFAIASSHLTVCGQLCLTSHLPTQSAGTSSLKWQSQSPKYDPDGETSRQDMMQVITHPAEIGYTTHSGLCIFQPAEGTP
jgi:hypothetical protein